MSSKSAQRGAISLGLSLIASPLGQIQNGRTSEQSQSLATRARRAHGLEWTSTSTLTQTQSMPRAQFASPPMSSVSRASVNSLQSVEFPSRKEKIWLLAVNCARSWPPHTGGYRVLEEERRPGTHTNFTISIISEICRKIVHMDFELDWVICVFTIEWWKPILESLATPTPLGITGGFATPPQVITEAWSTCEHTPPQVITF